MAIAHFTFSHIVAILSMSNAGSEMLYNVPPPPPIAKQNAAPLKNAPNAHSSFGIDLTTVSDIAMKLSIDKYIGYVVFLPKCAGYSETIFFFLLVLVEQNRQQTITITKQCHVTIFTSIILLQIYSAQTQVKYDIVSFIMSE